MNNICSYKKAKLSILITVLNLILVPEKLQAKIAEVILEIFLLYKFILPTVKV